MDTASDHSFVKAAASWALIIALGGAVWYRTYYNDPRKRAPTAKTVSQAKQDLGRDVASATTAMKKKADKALKPKSKPTSSRSENAAATTSEYDVTAEAAAKRDEQKANQDFAQSFSKLKSGHQFSSTKTEKKKQKSVKQSRAQEADTPAANASAPSSAAGDADDDLSSTASPVAAPADKTGVSDMLEATSPGPSVLRLTNTDSVSKPTTKKEKAADDVESKKQRQNRLKAERKKLEREQEEVERKKLEEAQRRRARIAEGRPAKDGSSFVANKENAWTAKPNGESTPLPIQPLDTFEQKPVEVPASLSTPKPTATGSKEQSDSWLSSLPSEEEQIAQVLEDSSSWNEVTTKKGKKGKKTQELAPEPATLSAANLSTAQTPVSAPVAKSPVNGNKPKPAMRSNSSFAALTPEETADDDDEVEEEWEARVAAAVIALYIKLQASTILHLEAGILFHRHYTRTSPAQALGGAV
ncbi:putative BSD domain-containing protein [Seiridium cardinale]